MIKIPKGMMIDYTLAQKTDWHHIINENRINYIQYNSIIYNMVALIYNGCFPLVFLFLPYQYASFPIHNG